MQSLQELKMNFILPSKKKVQFADILGQDLVKVRQITPNNSQENFFNLLSSRLHLPEIICDAAASKQLVCDFRRHLNDVNFPQRVITQNVCLENIAFSGFVITGIVRVKNIAHQKQVFVRYTLDGWKSYRDSWADFVPFSSNGITDKFSFRIQIPNDLDTERKIDFAICYRVGRSEYWDNNFNGNYTVDVREKFKVRRHEWAKHSKEW